MSNKAKLGVNVRGPGNFSLLPGLVFVLAACLKTHQLATSPFGLFPPPFAERIWAIGWVYFEFCLGFFLLSKWKPMIARNIAFIVFFLFTIVSLFRLANGYDSCGCFGFVHVSPFSSLVLNAICIVVLCSTPISNDTVYRHQVKFAAGICAIFLVFSTISAMQFTTSDLNAAGRIIGDGKGVLLRPQSWISKQFPLAGYTDRKTDVAKGKWQVFLYVNGCDRCRELIDEKISSPQEVPIVFIELSSPGEVHQDSDEYLWRTLNQQYNWFAEVPCTIDIHDGIVQNVSSEY